MPKIIGIFNCLPVFFMYLLIGLEVREYVVEHGILL
jgi:hypothetical protein